MHSIPRHWLTIAIIIHILVAWFSLGHYHDDEYAQIINFATSKIGLDMQSQLSWEFDSQVRSGFQPFIAFVISKSLSLIGVDSATFLAFFYRLLSGVISLTATLVLISALKKEIKSENVLKWTTFFLLFSWIFLFTNVRFSSEGWATSFFILGLGLYLHPSLGKTRHYFAIGFFLGLAFLARYQVGFMLLGLGLWMLFIQRIQVRSLITILVAGILTLILGAGFDWWLYGEPVVSSWQYFKWHYDGLTSASGGISTSVYEPWWFYIQYSALQLIPPIKSGA